MSEEVKFIRGNDRINQFAQRPDIAAEVAQIRTEMAEADRTYDIGGTARMIVSFADGRETTLNLSELA